MLLSGARRRVLCARHRPLRACSAIALQRASGTLSDAVKDQYDTEQGTYGPGKDSREVLVVV